jgi:charged multivesicular body protein 3
LQLERATQKSRSELKVLAKKNDVKSARILAKELVRANKQRDRLVSSKARMGSVQMQLQHQLCEFVMHLLLGSFLREMEEARVDQRRIPDVDRMRLIIAMVKVTGAFQKSTEIMKTTNQLIKLPQLSATMREMSMEMMKVSLRSRRTWFLQSFLSVFP